ncbi:DUF4259 domain-containing protein [Gorillibacterium sp. CAU 1737]|uniref:DUF4259 domain-containing protein n=1 Tax=Gorillibacterium sp. CAU 1737 TaxID=3140362 RepID=UPI00325FEC74
MGAWGHGNFDNDTVLDWVADLTQEPGLTLLTEAIEAVLEDVELDADTASIGLGAIEVLAALQDRPWKDQYEDEELTDWIKEHNQQGAHLLEKAQASLRKIREESELKELWEESDHYEDWVDTIKELEDRLKGSSGE